MHVFVGVGTIRFYGSEHPGSSSGCDLRSAHRAFDEGKHSLLLLLLLQYYYHYHSIATTVLLLPRLYTKPCCISVCSCCSAHRSTRRHWCWLRPPACALSHSCSCCSSRTRAYLDLSSLLLYYYYCCCCQ